MSSDLYAEGMSIPHHLPASTADKIALGSLITTIALFVAAVAQAIVAGRQAAAAHTQAKVAKDQADAARLQTEAARAQTEVLRQQVALARAALELSQRQMYESIVAADDSNMPMIRIVLGIRAGESQEITVSNKGSGTAFNVAVAFIDPVEDKPLNEPKVVWPRPMLAVDEEYPMRVHPGVYVRQRGIIVTYESAKGTQKMAKLFKKSYSPNSVIENPTYDSGDVIIKRPYSHKDSLHDGAYADAQ